MKRTTRWAAPIAAAAMIGLGGEAWAQPGSPPSEHVVVISIDGLRPDAIETFERFGVREVVRTGTAALERGSKNTANE